MEIHVNPTCLAKIEMHCTSSSDHANDQYFYSLPLATLRIIQLLPIDPRIIPASRCLVDIKMTRNLSNEPISMNIARTRTKHSSRTHIIAIGTVVRNQHLNRLRSALRHAAARSSTSRIPRVSLTIWRSRMDDAVASATRSAITRTTS